MLSDSTSDLLTDMFLINNTRATLLSFYDPRYAVETKKASPSNSYTKYEKSSLLPCKITNAHIAI